LQSGDGLIVEPSFCLLFHNQHLSCANESLRLRLILREEGQVAGLEPPNGLGASSTLSGIKTVGENNRPYVLVISHS